MTTLAVVPDAGPKVPVLEGRGLTKSFWVKRGSGLLARRSRLHAVDDVSLQLMAGAVTAVVGESGSGKTTVARLLARIVKPDAGDVLLDGEPVAATRSRAFAAQVQMVFQDPFASLNPVHRIRHHLARPLQIHHTADGDVEQAVMQLLHRVALDPPAKYADKFPHELSGGQRQRVAIARALAVRPRVLLADEPVSMLDVSIRLGVLNLLADLRDREQLAILYVTHDIASARYLADTIVVMYAGQLVEVSPSVRLTDSPAHPYTQLLLSAAPDPERLERPVLAARGAPPSLLAPPPGCRFHPRCPHVMDICKRTAPPTVTVAPGHSAACWLHVDNGEHHSDVAMAPSTPVVALTGESEVQRPP
ncbi:MAG: ABC transporter ATP-binding protein [Candidatus Dormibacteria bacterium]|jgi:peptide/nickel transport system ATP-binding protein